MLLQSIVSQINPSWRIEEIAWAQTSYRRPRKAGCNARLGVHGWGGEVPLARVRINGTYGFGWCTLSREQAGRFTGMPVRALFDENGLLRKPYRGLEFPLLDWLGQFAQKPVYQLVSDEERAEPFCVPVYDTTIYFDELDISDNAEAVDFICQEVAQGLNAGHRNFKVKIGRPGMWMGLQEGLKRDIDIILAIREKIGPEGKLMVDANNGYNLNLAKEFLSATRSTQLYWLEEAFHEDDMLYRNLKDWMAQQGICTKIADGEGLASSAIEDWAKKGLIDVLQYDLRGYGFFSWLELAKELQPFGVLCAPHNYGGYYGNFAQAHFAAGIGNFAFAEWDQAQAEGVDASAYAIDNGMILVPQLPGFGLTLDNEQFDALVQRNGWRSAQ
ncbi:MAG TPA: mandelate racemase [Candidatus Gallacutalibacter stercoravium]|nr:mandelate racemase [Candidatus Gallacutalibacter stercoravium]